MIYPRPEEKTLSVQREPVDATCPECGGSALERYPVLSEGGWWDVVKCQECLCSVERTRGALLGPVTTAAALIPDARG